MSLSARIAAGELYMSAPLRFFEAARRTRRIGEVYQAWCAGRADGLALDPDYPMHLSPSLRAWWSRGYRHGLTERPRFQQLELFGGGGSTPVAVQPAAPRKLGHAATDARAASTGGGI